jgi:hypothetical protein
MFLCWADQPPKCKIVGQLSSINQMSMVWSCQYDFDRVGQIHAASALVVARPKAHADDLWKWGQSPTCLHII